MNTTSSTTVPSELGATTTNPAQALFAGRLTSVDALRGFDLLWIVGAHGFVNALAQMSHWPFFKFLELQLDHVEWRGMRFYDLIFPLFVFLVGVSIVFSLPKILATEGRTAAYRRIFRRFALLFLVALFYSGGFASEWPNIRLLGVLNRIALAYLFAALLFCHFRWRGLALACATLLLGYWALMAFVPFPDVRPVGPDGQLVSEELTVQNVNELNWASTKQLRGVYEPGVNLAHYLDQKYLPGKKWDGTWDPEGLLSTLPAIGTCLLGVLAGLLLRNSNLTDASKVKYLFGAGVACAALGWLWSLNFPVIKKIWTSSYVLVAGGYSAMLLAVFHQITEVWQWRRWAQPFVWVGANTITLYLGSNLLDYGSVAKRIAGGDVKAFLDQHLTPGAGDFLLAAVAVGIVIGIAHFLYRRKIFLRL